MAETHGQVRKIARISSEHYHSNESSPRQCECCKTVSYLTSPRKIKNGARRPSDTIILLCDVCFGKKK